VGTPTLKDRILQAAKGFAGGLAGAIVSILFTTVTDPNAVVNPDAPDSANAVVQLPNTTAEWVTFGIAVLVGFVLPFLQKNYPSVAQAIAQLNQAKARQAVGKQKV
jgi:multisubunit Na+/H+ antiporter MnhB subunit